jgi:glycosyltransferase involved in cell wall biosynthesis
MDVIFMDILYVSDLCSKDKFKELFEKSKIIPGQPGQKYHRLMAEGLVRNKGVSINTLSAIPVNRAMSAKLYYKGEIEEVDGVEYRYLAFINFPILRHICLFFTCFFSALKWCLNNKKGVIICDVLDITVSMATLLASRIARRSSIGIVTDVPSFLAEISKNRITFISKMAVLISTFTMNRFNLYVFLTEYMNMLINKKRRPYVLIEGLVDIDMANITNELSGKYEKKVCMYAGQIRNVYGIKLLTDAFIAAGVDNTELHIYGSGDFEEELKKICQKHADIKYFGVIPNDIVVKEQLKATLLVNPRPTNKEYTKYSFPSKNMEYMVSGTPTLTSNLPGMPEEYKKYVYLIDDQTVEGLTNSLRVVFSKTKEELHQKGMIAKDFVLHKKNNIIQAKKILDMINKEQ